MSEILNKFKKSNLQNWVLLVLLVIIVVIIAYYRVTIQVDIGPPYDAFDYLANAAELAGQSIGYSDPRPPFLSFLTSLVFRVNGLSEAPIFFIDGIIYVIGVIGLYLFLKLRFSTLNSFFGSLLYATFPIVLTYVGVGYPDLPSVSISIWALYLTVLAVRKDSRYFSAAFPLVMISFLTKFNQILIIFPIILYLYINWQQIKHKNLFIGLIISLSVLIPFLIFFNWKYGDPLWLFMDFYSTSEGTVIGQINTDSSFYIKYLPFVVGNIGLLTILIIFGGLIFSWFKLIRNKIDLSTIKGRVVSNVKLKIFIILILFSVFILTLGTVSYILSELLFLILISVFYKLLEIDNKHDIDFLFFSWFIVFLIFQSVFVIKDIRYFLCLLPPLAYFLIRGLNLVENQVGPIKNRKLTVYLIPVLVVMIIISTSYYLPTLALANQDNKNIDKDMADASKWLTNYDSGYKSKVIYSDLWALSGWYLQTEIKKLPRFRGNMTYYYSAPSYNLTDEDISKINNELIKNNAEYYFSTKSSLNLTNYQFIKQFGHVTIYKRIQ